MEIAKIGTLTKTITQKKFGLKPMYIINEIKQ